MVSLQANSCAIFVPVSFTGSNTDKAGGSFGGNINGFPPSNSPFGAYNPSAFAVKPSAFGDNAFGGRNRDIAPIPRANGGSASKGSSSSKPAVAPRHLSPRPSVSTTNAIAFTPLLTDHQARSPEDEEKINAALAALAAAGYGGLTAESLGKLNPPDEYATELQVMAEVRGYFQIAYKVREIDFEYLPHRSHAFFVESYR